MNELQLGLLAIGVVAIVAVLGFNRWQERKYRRQAEQRFQSSHDDVLLTEHRVTERWSRCWTLPRGWNEILGRTSMTGMSRTSCLPGRASEADQSRNLFGSRG